MGHYYEIGYKGHRKITFAQHYEDAVEMANALWGGCDFLRVRD